VAIRYSATNQALHWTTALLMFALLPVAWIVDALPEDTPKFLFWLDVHKTLGLMVLFLTLFRLCWRLRDQPPALPRSMPRLNKRVAHGVYLLLFIVMIGMPVSGYIWSTGHGYDVDFMGLIQMPRLAWNNKGLGDLAKSAHVWGRWLVYGVISLHLLGVVYHVLFRADGLLGRMLPANAIEPAKEK